ncbi:MAG: hypothetical protein LUQ64_01240 [Methanomicrobiales archaeon]|nr:hypothetical protein [Methanomicrobiales archaeon]
MPAGIPLKTPDTVKQELREYLGEIDVEDIQEFDGEGSWGFWVRFGEYPILIENLKDTRYMVVALQVTLPAGEPVERLTALYQKNDAQFNYEILRNFSSPITGFSRIFDGEKLVGFTVSRYLYPFHPNFSIRNLDAALQAVVSVTSVGVAYLKTLLGEWDLEKKLPRTEPGPMYG